LEASTNLFAFSLPVKTFLNLEEPVFIFWKDKDSIYQGCNEFMATIAGHTAASVVNKSDHDLSWHSSANILIHDDKQAMLQDDTKIFMEPITSIKKESFIDMSIKTPLKNSAGHIVGVFGLSFPLRNLVDYDIVKTFIHDKNILPNNLFEIINRTKPTEELKIDGIPLTSRKLECLYYLARGKKPKEIAQISDISPRTIEDHIREMKGILNCSTTSQLIDKAWSHNLPLLYSPANL
jgi:DNA-binding CsgD family transcriptional regulator